MSGSNLVITGSAESVSSFSVSGSSISIGGTCQGASISISGSSINVAHRVYSAAPVVNMPDFSALIQMKRKQMDKSTSVIRPSVPAVSISILPSMSTEMLR